MILLKCCTQYASKFGKLRNGNRTGKSVFISILKEDQCQRMFKLLYISHASEVILKILQVRLQQYLNQELADVQAGFRKGRGTRYQIANRHWIIEKAREFQKKSTSISMTMLKTLTVWITINCGIFLKKWEYQTTLPTS